MKRKIIQIDEERCNGCGLCVPACAEGAIAITDGKARLVAEKYCDGLGACLGECPQDALTIIEADVEAFDMEAAEAHVKALTPATSPEAPSMPCGCPSTLIQLFPTAAACEKAGPPAPQKRPASALSHWPVQIRLAPTTAPFLKNADLLVTADCAPVAYAGFHQDFLAGKTVLMGCPKFDDAAAYVEKFTEIFRRNAIRSVTVLVMEVPCCQGLPAIIAKAMKQSGQEIPMNVVVIGLRGEILRSTTL
ncbi:MAG: 4Fe-4S ferredoxin [Syntrophus sp. (in: bacteria)]|nr:4Fe-4S ferredoxin [Syntrophus sp. (in: bacteria)]